METKVSDLLQGTRNCPPDIIPVQCSNCTVIDRRNDRFRNACKPRCAEPNFVGPAVLKGVNDGGFDHQNIRFALHTPFAPPFYCVCGRKDFRIVASKKDRLHFPAMRFKCDCGREKPIIVFAKDIDLAEPWVSEKTARRYYDLKPDTKSTYDRAMTCSCKRHYFSVLYEKSGYSFYPNEGPAAVLECRACGRWKKILLRAEIDASLPWVSKEMEEWQDEIVVRCSSDLCPDIRKLGDEETVFVVMMEEE